MEEQHFPSRSDRHKQEHAHKHEKIKNEKPKKADRSGIFFSRETEDLELTIGRDKAGRFTSKGKCCCCSNSPRVICSCNDGNSIC